MVNGINGCSRSNHNVHANFGNLQVAGLPAPGDPASDTVISVVGDVSRFMQYCN